MKRLNHYLLAFFMLLICASCADEAESDFLTKRGKQKESYWSIDRSLPSNLQSINTQNNKSVFMNWGQGGQNDDVACTPSVSSSWLNTYNGYKQIFY